MRERIETVVKALVRQPEMVSVEETSRRSMPMFSLTVAAQDRGAVLGRQGTTIRALETLVAAICRAQGEPVRGIELCDESRS